MIDWQKSKIQFGTDQTNWSSIKRPRVAVTCDKCGKESSRKIYVRREVVNDQMPWECPKCVLSRPGLQDRIRASLRQTYSDPRLKELVGKAARKRWANPTYCESKSRELKKRWMDAQFRQLVSDNSKKHVNTPEKRAKYYDNKDWCERQRQKQQAIRPHMESTYWNDPKYQALLARKNKERDQSFRTRLSELGTKRHQDHPDYLKSLRDNMPKVSSLQTLLYSILTDLGVKYHREYNDRPDDPGCKIANYSFDCVIPRPGDKTLLIDVNGDWIHSQPRVRRIDSSKSSYIANNLADTYDYRILWEHEFKCRDKVIETIKYWLGITKLELVKFDFNKVSIKPCEAVDYKQLLAKYHYLPTAGRGGHAYGAYLGGELIAVCVFSSLIRQNINIDKFEQDEIRELSRLCIHPRYQKKNFASWFVSRCIKTLDPKYRCIISYCDTTFDHDGATYKACNFKLDKIIRPDYWYVDKSGWVMHKKTLYNHAIKTHMTEVAFATEHGYDKVFGKNKLRFVYIR